MNSRFRLSVSFALFAMVLITAVGWAQNGPRTIPQEILVKFIPGARGEDKAAARALVNGQGLRSFDFIRVEHIKVSGMSAEQAIGRLRNHPHVEYAEPNFEVQASVVPNDPRFPELYGMRNTGQTGGTAGADIKAVNAWDVFTGDPNLKIGVIDTGVDYNHPDLAANAWTNPGEIAGNNIDDDLNGFIDDIHGYDFVNNDGNPMDDNGHGTHCSGTIAGVGNNGVGVAGVCWSGKIVGIKFLSASGSGSTANAIAGVNYAITVGTKLTSNSWGGGGFSQALLDAINAAGAAGQLFVAAAGNASTNTDVTPSYPASYNSPYIISVAATDHNDNLASFSNFGATTVDLAAPGVSILSCQPGGGYQLLSGTSMATPHVSGAVALAMGRFPNASNLQIKQLMLLGVDVKPQLAGKCLTGGRLNAFLTIADPDETPPGMVNDLATNNPGSNTMGLTWTATGDDGGVGRASSYEIRYSTSPITDLASFLAGTLVAGPDPQTAGSTENTEVKGLAFTTTYYFALRAKDEFGNAGPVSNVPTGTTLGIPNLSASPASFSANLLTGGTSTQTLTIQNTAAGTLDWSIATPELQFTQPAPHPPVTIAKGDDDWRIGDPVVEGHGGPDGAGYRWKDSNDAGGPAFNWIDITAIGTQIPLTVDDGFSASIPMGMSFPFYGNTFSTMRVHSNGFLSFTETTGAFDGNQPLPTSGAAANLVAPFWDDLDFRTAQAPNARAYYHQDGTRLVVSWVNVPGFNGVGGPYTFQAILYPTGEVRFQYLSMGSPTNSATTGIQNGTKTIGLNVAFNTAYAQNNLVVRILQLAQWLRAQPSSGRVLAGQSQNVEVIFDATGLDGGTYTGTIEVASNDPDGSSLHGATLGVTGAPDIAVNPASFDFGTVFVGAQPTQMLNVSNPGTAPLDVTGITSGHAAVTVNPSSFTLAPRAAINVTVQFSPLAPEVVNTTLAIASNDPDTPSKTVPVTGTAVPAPVVSVSPEQFNEALLSNTSTTRSLRISNSGGSNYVFTAQAQVAGPSGPFEVFDESDNVDLPKDAQDVQSGPTPLKVGGPDAFGYTYRDSDEPGGPVFSWIDISATGTQIPLNGDDQNLGPFPIGFNFPHYGGSFSSFRVCSNGWVTLNATNTQTTFTNTALPNSGSTVPPSLLAVFWDDLDFRPAEAPNARVYYRYDGTRLIIQFKSVERRSETAPASDFEILLYPNGAVVYQYLAMNMTLKTSATIGMQNAAKNQGLQVVFNAAYVKNNLAVRFLPPADFLSVTPTSGTVPPGQYLDLTVGFDATGLFGGVYNELIHITGNDPLQPVKEVPAQLTVTGVPDIAVSPATIDFGTVFIGFPQLRQLTINNPGTDVLVISSITASDPVYGVDQTNFTVPALGSAALFASFNPAAVASYPATFTIESNDPDTPSKIVPISGSAIIPPDVSTTPTSIAATLNIPDGTTRTLTVHNTGGSDLTFTAGASLTAGVAVNQYDPIELEKEENDPRPGVLGNGGPDAFGYTWHDSDDPGGPAFDWVDITSVGTPIPFTGDDQNQGPFALPFAFPFYGATFNSVRVCTNGWLSFTSTSTDFTNDPLPNTAAPENLVAAFWDDLTFSATGDAYHHFDGQRFIVSWVGVPRLTSGGPYTFQIQLYPSGTIRFMYQSMQGTRLNEATVGIQNAARNIGLMAVHNNTYVHDNLAVEFRTLPEYMTVSPTSGTIPVGGSADLTVAFESDGLFGGVYNGAIRIASNDPDEGVLMVPTSLTAIGVPQIAAIPVSLDFGNVYVGNTADRDVVLRNVGSDPLNVTGVSFTDPQYSLVAGDLPVTLGQNGSANLTVRFTPVSDWTVGAACPPPTAVPANLVVASNDPDGPFAVPLTGTEIVPPEVDPVPASVTAALAPALGPTATTKTKTVLLKNLGCSDLTFNAEALSALPQAISGASVEGPKDDAGEPGEPTILAHGGPDAAGYRWADSDDPFGPAFDWVDITAVGTPIPFTGDDQNQGPFPLPFPFTYYGQTFNSFRACTNGWITFTATNTQTTFTNTTLPNAGSTVPPNLLAAFWDDLTFSSAGDVYYHYDGEKFIISYVNVPRLTSGGPYTFQILLYPSGTIDFQYLTMAGTRLNEATVGIQNATKDIGLQVVFNANYVKNNHRIRFTRQPNWLTVSPASGVVPAGGELALAVAMDATGLADGDHSGLVRLSTNDLDEGTKDVPVNLHVGYVSAVFEMDPNALNRSANGKWLNALVTPPDPNQPEDILTSSVLLQRTLGVAEGAPVAYEDGVAQYKFDRATLLDLLPSGDEVPVEVIGEVEDVTWFSGTDAVRVLPPVASLNGGGQHYVADTDVDLVWSDPPGRPADTFDLWYSANDGETWTQIAAGLTTRTYRWRVPSQGTQTGRIEIVALDEQGPMGSYISDPFTIQTGVTGVEDQLPVAFGLEMAGANPTRGTARLEMALPRASEVEVRVYDVRGRQVRDLASGGFNAGRHLLRWDGLDQAGSPVGAGIYFVRMNANGESYRVRFAYMR